MSEFKPKRDDHRTDEDIGKQDRDGDSPKPHGDKLQHAVDEAAKPAQPFSDAVQHATENSLKDTQGAVRRPAPEQGAENDWQDRVAELESVMTEQDIEFESVDR
jgi:hypothetical protein